MSTDSEVETSNDSNDNFNVHQKLSGHFSPFPSLCTSAMNPLDFYKVALPSKPPHYLIPRISKISKLSNFYDINEEYPDFKTNFRYHKEYMRKSIEDKIDKTVLNRTRKRHLNMICKQKLKAKLNIAVCLNNTLLTATLLQNSNSPINCQDSFGRTPLHYAACKGYSDMVYILLMNGANPNLQDCIGNTPLHLATVAGNREVVKLLLETGVDVEASDLRGTTPMNLAMAKLSMLLKCKTTEDMVALREEAREIGLMLIAQLRKKQQEAKAQKQIEALTDVCSRLSLSSTSEQVQDGIKDLLENINALNITE